MTKKNKPLKSILVLTVGVGTVGGNSDIHHGLVYAIEEKKTDGYMLVPSRNADSIALSDMIRESVVGSLFIPYSEDSLYLPVDNANDLLECRLKMRMVVRRAKERCTPDHAVIVNPVSGTKQMSLGALLAALDERIQTLAFIVGPRSGGTVISGCEQVQAISLSSIFQEQALEDARLLANSGNMEASYLLLNNTAGIPPDRIEWYRILDLWQKFKYREALIRTKSISAKQLREGLSQKLTTLSGNSPISLIHGVDLFLAADRLLSWRRPTDCIVHLYRALELLGKLLLKASGILILDASRKSSIKTVREKYRLKDNLIFRISSDLRRKIELVNAKEVPGLGLKDVYRLVKETDETSLKEPQCFDKLFALLQKRNQTVSGHGLEEILSIEAEEAINLFRFWLRKQFQGADKLIKKLKWSAFEVIEKSQ